METKPCELCGTPYQPRRVDEHYCCKGCEFVDGLVGQKGAGVARAVKQGYLGSNWFWAVVFLILASTNGGLAFYGNFAAESFQILLMLLAGLFFCLSMIILLAGVRALRKHR